MKVEKRFIPNAFAGIEVRADGEDRKIEGYASVFYDGSEGTEFHLYDNVYERIAPQAFQNAIGRDDVRALFNHDPNYLLGRTKSGTLQLDSDSRGLRYSIQPPDTTAGRDTLESVKRGDLTGSSFSFIPTSVTWLDEGERHIRQINDVELFDVGPVTFPAYEGSQAYARDVDSVKAEEEAIKAEQEAELKKQKEAQKQAEEEAKAKAQAEADSDYADAVIGNLHLKKD